MYMHSLTRRTKIVTVISAVPVTTGRSTIRSYTSATTNNTFIKLKTIRKRPDYACVDSVDAPAALTVN